MKKITIISSLLVALCIGFFSVVPVRNAHAFNYVVQKFDLRLCVTYSHVTNECTQRKAGPTYNDSYGVIYLASLPTGTCKLPDPEAVYGLDGTTFIFLGYKAYEYSGTTSSTIPGASCSTGPGGPF